MLILCGGFPRYLPGLVDLVIHIEKYSEWRTMSRVRCSSSLGEVMVLAWDNGKGHLVCVCVCACSLWVVVEPSLNKRRRARLDRRGK